jgi:hypothetical protein
MIPPLSRLSVVIDDFEQAKSSSQQDANEMTPLSILMANNVASHAAFHKIAERVGP